MLRTSKRILGNKIDLEGIQEVIGIGLTGLSPLEEKSSRQDRDISHVCRR